MRKLTAIAFALALMTSAVDAQNRRGGPAGGSNVQQTTNIINDCEQRTNKFKKTLDKALARDNVRAAIAIGNDINAAMRNWNMGGDAESEWAALRVELNRLASTFNLPHIR